MIDGAWTTNAGHLIQRELDLSNAEHDLLLGLLAGSTTQEIAELRGRSHGTIRTRMYNLMGRMDARTQTELLRDALSVSQFVDKVRDIANVLRFPRRKRVNDIRPKGSAASSWQRVSSVLGQITLL